MAFKLVNPMNQCRQLYTAIVRVIPPEHQQEFTNQMQWILQISGKNYDKINAHLLETGSLLHNYPEAYYEAKKMREDAVAKEHIKDHKALDEQNKPNTEEGHDATGDEGLDRSTP